MGYTHYFDWERTEDKPMIHNITKKVQNDILNVINRHKDILDPTYTIDCGVVIINGNPAYETLYIEAGISGFCKTNEYPYDIAVCEILLIFKHHYGELFELSSDGFWVSRDDLSTYTLDGTWNQALDNIEEKFGYKFNLIPVIENNYYHFEIDTKEIIKK